MERKTIKQWVDKYEHWVFIVWGFGLLSAIPSTVIFLITRNSVIAFWLFSSWGLILIGMFGGVLVMLLYVIWNRP